MVIDVSKIQSAKNGTFSFTFSFQPNATVVLNTPYQVAGEAEVNGSLILEADAVILKSTMRVPMHYVCDRCGGAFEENLFIETNEKIVQGESEDFYTYEGSSISLIPILENEIMLHLPTHVLCRPDCKGLCKICGANLNETTCQCAQTQVGENNPFAALKGKIK